MQTAKRGRACDACHSIKIKCELGSNSSSKQPPCERCTRLGKECRITPPARQKERVAELEAKVEALTRLLELQNIQTPASSIDSVSAPDVKEPPSRKRRWSAAILSSDKVDGSVDEVLPKTDNNGIDLDRVLDQRMQEQIFNKYCREIDTSFPLAPLIVQSSYEDARENWPFLLQVVIYVAGPAILSIEMQDRVSQVIIDLIEPIAITKQARTLELIQALIVLLFWWRPPANNIRNDWYRLIDLIAEAAKETGLTETASLSSIFDFEDKWRTWIAYYLLDSNMTLTARLPQTIQWTDHDESQIFRIEYWRNGTSSDRLLCQYIRASQLCSRISQEAKFTTFDEVTDLSDPNTQKTMRRLSISILDWKAQILPSVSSPILKIWEDLPVIFLHEPVLHTETNKEFFAAPYLAERLSVADFPAPFVTEQHIISLFSLRDACHRVLDFVLSLDIKTVVGMPAVLSTARALYAAWLLIKLYIATTALGNTYGAFLDPQSLDVEKYLSMMIVLGDAIQETDPHCGSGKVMEAPKRLQEWFLNYTAKLPLPLDDIPAMYPTPSTDLDDILSAYPMPNTDMIPQNAELDWTALARPDEQFDFGLEDIFAGI